MPGWVPTNLFSAQGGIFISRPYSSAKGYYAVMLIWRKWKKLRCCKSQLPLSHVDTARHIPCVDRRRNYGRTSKFKMAAVRHLRIVISSYRTTHEVFSLGNISLSNFYANPMHIFKDNMAIWIFLQIWLEMPIHAPKFRFLGSEPLNVIGHHRNPRMAHPCILETRFINIR